MKIALYVGIQDEVQWNKNTIMNAGLGTIWGSTYGLARALREKGHEVVIWGYVNTPDVYDGVEYRDIETDKTIGRYDVIIGVESFPETDQIKGTKKVLWFRHTKHSEIIDGAYDILVLRSDVQKKFLESEKHLPARTRVIPDGVNDIFFSQVSENRPLDIIFVGHPVKGMNDIIEFTKILREKSKDTQVHVYGNAEIWGWDNDKFNLLYHNMIKEGILYHGRIGLKTIAKRLRQSKVFIYPCNIEIAMGVAVLEAMAGGAVPVTTSMGNLPNIVNDSTGRIIEGDTKSFAWMSKATDATVELLQNESTRNRLSREGTRYVEQNYRWKDIATKWETNVLT